MPRNRGMPGDDAIRMPPGRRRMRAVLAGGLGEIPRCPETLPLLFLFAAQAPLLHEVNHVGHGDGAQNQQRRNAQQNPMIHCVPQ